jgi:triacylglycerol lipase
VGAAVRWVGENIDRRGGDPARVFLMGHSAGAVHVATYLAQSRFHGPRGVGLAGAILACGLYDLTAHPPGEPEKAYFGEDTSKYAERSSLAGLLQARIPLMTVCAELDPPIFQEEARTLNAALAKAGHPPRAVALAKHGHMSETYAVNTADTSLSGELLSFIKGGM